MPAKKSAAETNAAPGKHFELNDVELETLKSTRGRKPEPSVYLAEVQNAAEHPGVAFGISLTQTLRGPWVMAQLRKAGTQHGIDSKLLNVFDRSENTSKDHPHGFIAYRVKAQTSSEASE